MLFRSVEEQKGNYKVNSALSKFVKQGTNENMLLGYSIHPLDPNETIIQETELDIEMKKINRCINYYQEYNGVYLKGIDKRINEIKLNNGNSFNKDSQVTFLENEIYKLELKQLSESILLVYSYDNPTHDYELTLDPTLGLLSIRADQLQLKLMSKYRECIFHASPYDAAIASAKKFGCTNAENPKPAIKQIANLFNTEIINREIDFSEYGFCHHCKEIQPLERLVKCKKNSRSHIVRLFLPKGNKAKTIPNFSQNKEANTKLACDRMYCFGCIFFNYDLDPNIVQENSSWICPYCQDQCFCTRCLRNSLISRLKTIHNSLIKNMKKAEESALYISKKRHIPENETINLYMK